MNEISTEIVIIGAGPAGLMAAYAALNSGARVVVLEKMPRVARKLMITGKGRCNFTNLKSWNDFSQHIHPKANFLKPSFYNFTPEKLINFFEDHYCPCVVTRSDRVFPASYKASDIVDTLLSSVVDLGAILKTNFEVASINVDANKYVVRSVSGQIVVADKLIIATGGLSYPSTGSTGDGYTWAKQFGHKISPCLPSLTAIVPKAYKLLPGKSSSSFLDQQTSSTNLKGHIDRSTPLSEWAEKLKSFQLKNVALSIYVDGNLVDSEFGDLDFTDGGIEGPIGFQLSRKVVKAISNGSRVSIAIDLKPAVELKQLQKRIDEMDINNDKLRFFLPKFMPKEIIPAFILTNPKLKPSNLGLALKAWKFDIDGYVGYERCVVTAGGVSQDDVNPKTMESKLQHNLYFAGEVLDLDADTGGYNLQIAFSTGYLAGQSASH